jgi:hypothetical protein
MAAPGEITIKDLSGDWVMVRIASISNSYFKPHRQFLSLALVSPPHLSLPSNCPPLLLNQSLTIPQNKTLSDDTDAVLTLQGIGWLTRKAVGLATITLHTKQYTDSDNITHIDIDQTATGGIKGTTEIRVLNWAERDHKDYFFGHLKGRSRWLANFDEIEDPIESYVVNAEKGWTAQQVWGFAIVDGKRYHTRRVVVTKGQEVSKVRLVFNRA